MRYVWLAFAVAGVVVVLFAFLLCVMILLAAAGVEGWNH